MLIVPNPQFQRRNLFRFPTLNDLGRPLAIGREREIGIGFVVERLVSSLGSWLLGQTVLGPVRLSLKLRVACQFAGLEKRIFLGIPGRTSFFQSKQRPEETSRSSVFIQPPHEVCDCGFELVVQHGGRVDGQPTDARGNFQRLGVGHSFEHLKLDSLTNPASFTHQHRMGHIKQIVAGDAQAHDRCVLRSGTKLQHPFEIGIDRRFVVIGRLRPTTCGRLNLFHGEISALDQSNLDSGTGTGMPLPSPFGQFPLHGIRVGKISLQHDAGFILLKFGLVEHFTEHVHGQVQIAILFHVEIDELRFATTVLLCGPIDLPQSLLNRLERLTITRHADLADDRAEFDRHIGHFRVAQLVEVKLPASIGLVVAENGFAQLIEVDANALSRSLAEVVGKLRRFGRDDYIRRLLADLLIDLGHYETRRNAREQVACPELGTIPALEKFGVAEAIDQSLKPLGRAVRLFDFQNLIRHDDRELFARFVLHHPGHLGRVCPLGRCLAHP